MNKWTCHKLESFSDFVNAYASTTREKDYCYLELFTGYGEIPCDRTDCSLEGSSLRAVKSRAKFLRYSFLAKNRAIARSLEQDFQPYNSDRRIQILSGNPNNENILKKFLDFVPRSASALVLIDPGGYRRLRWTTLEQLVTHGKNWNGEKMDLLIIFPLEMSLVRNLNRPECQESVTRFYGNRRWEEVKRQKQAGRTPGQDLKYRLVELFKDGLRDLGYRYVEDYKPASPAREPYYHLIYAGDSLSRLKNLKEAWGKPRFLRCELLYGMRTTKKQL